MESSSDQHAGTIERYLAATTAMTKSLIDLAPATVSAARLISECLSRDGTVLICGNGGSAAEAQHMAAELVGRFAIDRPGLSAISLTTDTSSLTAIGNDYGFERVFARQVEALGRADDVLVTLTTSGNSANVCEAARAGVAAGMAVVGLSGASGGALAGLCDICLCVASDDTPRIQEGHLILVHFICALVEDTLFGGRTVSGT